MAIALNACEDIGWGLAGLTTCIKDFAGKLKGGHGEVWGWWCNQVLALGDGARCSGHKQNYNLKLLDGDKHLFGPFPQNTSQNTRASLKLSAAIHCGRNGP